MPGAFACCGCDGRVPLLSLCSSTPLRTASECEALIEDRRLCYDLTFDKRVRNRALQHDVTKGAFLPNDDRRSGIEIELDERKLAIWPELDQPARRRH